jgi:hypothetical protein
MKKRLTVGLTALGLAATLAAPAQAGNAVHRDANDSRGQLDMRAVGLARRSGYLALGATFQQSFHASDLGHGNFVAFILDTRGGRGFDYIVAIFKRPSGLKCANMKHRNGDVFPTFGKARKMRGPTVACGVRVPLLKSRVRWRAVSQYSTNQATFRDETRTFRDRI